MKVRFTPQESPLPGVSCAPSKHFNSDRLQGVGVFKASAVRLVLDEGKTVGAAARDLDLTKPPCGSGSSGRIGRMAAPG